MKEINSFPNTFVSISENKFMIIVNVKKINPLFTENEEKINKFLEKYEKSLNNGYLSCPNCNSTDFIKWGNYERNIIFLANNECRCRVISIKRVKCKSCNHTHALLPEGIVPYKQHTLKTIIKAITNQTNVSENLIKKWKKQIRKIFKPLLRTTFKNKEPYKIKKLIEYVEDRMYFLIQNNRYFMQIKIITIGYAPS